MKLLVLILILPLALLAQETMIITGRITNFETGVALADANVMIIGTPYGAAASESGQYSVTIPMSRLKSDSVQISVNYIGYMSAVLTVPVLAGRSVIDFYLIEGALRMKEIVVTDRSMEPTRAEKARAYHVVTISREEIERSAAGNLLDVLETRVPGLRVVGSNLIGSSRRIVMRGSMYLSGKNTQPLIVLDGIPFPVANYDGSAITDLINGINLFEIEKIEVVKGQGMFWRYGTAAANGCIMIWTKKSTFEHR